ncbi:hypothetical protein F383_39415 [Gossypium arboreum]|nr:hypothetical protein F383_39415 [Gossypium arboreum]
MPSGLSPDISLA